MTTRKDKLKIFAYVLAFAMVTILVRSVFAPQTELALDSDCEIKGLLPQLRATVRAEGFWSLQSKALHREIERLENEPRRQEDMRRQIEQRLAEAMGRVDSLMADVRRQMEDRRTPEQWLMQAYQDSIDQLDYERRQLETRRTEALIEIYRMRRLGELRDCVGRLDG
jgi:septal ring factor EnvC (AmiA/AmiB activator)